VFEGVVSLEHGGGFASVRSSPGQLGLADAQACALELRGAPAPYKLSQLMDDGRDSVAWQAALQPDGKGWQVLRLPLAGFVARWRGRELPQAPPLAPARIRQLGLLTAGRRAGPFALDIRWIGLD
jgi:monofunctional biosynthetic peptidoglycan transglycosylase